LAAIPCPRFPCRSYPALGLEAHIGSLVAGKLADIVAVDLGGLDSLPLYDALSQLVYASARSQVRAVWVGGRQVVADGHLTTLDETELKHHAMAWRTRIAASS